MDNNRALNYLALGKKGRLIELGEEPVGAVARAVKGQRQGCLRAVCPVAFRQTQHALAFLSLHPVCLRVGGRAGNIPMAVKDHGKENTFPFLLIPKQHGFNTNQLSAVFHCAAPFGVFFIIRWDICRFRHTQDVYRLLLATGFVFFCFLLRTSSIASKTAP